MSDIWTKGKPSEADFKLGSVYDYYDIYEEIGSGAFGVVHRAVEKKTGRTFAAKFVRTPNAAEKNTVKKECEMMNQLIHPRLINLHDVFDEGDEMVLITELYVYPLISFIPNFIFLKSIVKSVWRRVIREDI